MSFLEALRKERRWSRRCLIVNLCHIHYSLRKKRWRLRDTAKKLELSVGAVSENIRLAQLILKDPTIEAMSRESALLLVKK